MHYPYDNCKFINFSKIIYTVLIIVKENILWNLDFMYYILIYRIIKIVTNKYEYSHAFLEAGNGIFRIQEGTISSIIFKVIYYRVR